MTPLDGTGLATQPRAAAEPLRPPRSPVTGLLGPLDAGPVTAVASSGSCLVSAVGAAGALRLVDLTDPGAPQLPLGAHGAPVQALVVSGGTAFSAGCDGRVLAWRLGGASLPVVVGTHRAGVTTATVASAGHLVAAGHDGYVLAWTGPVPETLGAHPGGVEALCLLESGAVVTAGRDGRLLCHEPVRDDRADQAVELHQRGRELTSALATVAPATVLSAGGQLGTIRLWTEPSADPCPEELGIHGGWVLALVPLGRGRVAAVGGRHVTVWDLPTGCMTRIALPPGVHARAGVTLATGDLVVTTAEGRLEVVAEQRGA